jgi:thiol-disulfide isomerase/thioredoxin
MAKKEGRVSLSRLLREANEKKRLRNRIVLVAVVTAALIISVAVFGYHAPSSPAYEFKSGVNPLLEFNGLLKQGSAVLLISHDSCQPVESVNSTFAALQEQYPNVTFASLNIDHNTTASNISKSFSITHVPAILVIRGDLTAAKFQPSDKAEGGTIQGVGISSVKSAIEDAQSWEHYHPFESWVHQ